MFYVNTEKHFSGAHKLLDYNGPCENLHGHNWKVRVCVGCRSLDHRGLAIDFKDLKAELNKILDEFDHKYLNKVLEPEKRNPSSENIAMSIYERLERGVPEGVSVTEVEVEETPGNSVVYTGERD